MKKAYLYFWLAIVLLSSAHLSAAGYTEIENRAKLPFLTPDLAERKVLKIRLDNGLEALLISDPKLDKSGAVLSVRVGSWDEPKDHPGLAHFLEHMLFLGTEKYPEESEYQQFITTHDGLANAFTANTFTSYLFSIDNQAFPEALDRFSHFFKDPLFNPSGVSRELQAIDQEFSKNLESDDWRILYVDKLFGNPEHPYHRFDFGNSKSLSHVSQDVLKEWYHQHYSANLMRLVVYSTLPLDQLRDLVVADFQGIPNHDQKEWQKDIHLYPTSQVGEMVYVEPVKNARTLTMIWTIPPQIADEKDAQPWTVVCDILGHEGEESLLANLKRDQLAEKLQCGTTRVGDRNMQFALEIELTDSGVDHVNDVIERVYQTIANFKAKGVPSYLFDELKKIATLNYQYQTREDVFTTLMQHGIQVSNEAMATYPEQTQIVQKFDAKVVQVLLNALTPQQAHLYLTAPAQLSRVTFDKREPSMGTAYTVRALDNSVIQEWSHAEPNPQIELPTPNPFIPNYLSVINTAQSKDVPLIPHPELIMDGPLGKVYFAADHHYLMPQILWKFEIKTPQVMNGDATKVVLADIYVKALTDLLKSFSYPATQAGLDFDFERADFGLTLTVSGFSDNAEKLLLDILGKLKTVQISESEFEIYKDSLQREYQNMAKRPPVEQAGEILRSLLYKNFSTSHQKAVAIQAVTFPQFTQYVTQLFEHTYLEGLLYGNMDKAQAERVVLLVNQSLNSQPAPEEIRRRPELVLLPQDRGPFFIEATTKAKGNAVLLAIQAPQFSFKARAAQEILMQAMDNPFFATLRTKQQTGYLVQSDARQIEKHLFNLFVVQSSTHAVRELLSRFELFIEGYLQEFPDELPETDFNTIRQALIYNLEQPPKNIEAMGRLLHKLAFEYGGDFDWIQHRIQGFKELTYPELIQFSQLVMGRNNHRRIAVLMKGEIAEEKAFNYNRITLHQLRKISEYNGSSAGNKNTDTH